MTKMVYVRLAALVVVTFLLTTIALTSYLAVPSVPPDSPHSLPSPSPSSLVETKILEENLQLRREIEELRQLVAQSHIDFTVQTPRNASRCLEFCNLDKLLNKTEVVRGKQYRSESLLEPYSYFDLWSQNQIHHGFQGVTSDRLNGNKRIEIDSAIDSALRKLNGINQLSSSRVTREEFLHGFYRHTDGVGIDYQLFFRLQSSTVVKTSVFRPFIPPLTISYSLVGLEATRLNIIIPLKGREETFAQFLNNLAPLVHSKFSIYLTIVYFGESTKLLLHHLQPFLIQYKYRNYVIHHIRDANFSRGLALDKGIRAWKGKSDPVIYLCDVDVQFGIEFVERCVWNSKRNTSAYFPIPFSFYNPQVVKGYVRNAELSKRTSKINGDFGFWRQFGFGMACMYRSDYLASGGFDVNITGWGEEDKLLFRKFAQSHLHVMRAPDPDLFHVWHEKQCDSNLSAVQYKGCIRTRTLNEGSHLQLGLLYLYGENITEELRSYKRPKGLT